MAAKDVDWEAVERDYRAGVLSVREIARRHEVSESGIRKKAKEKGWPRDLTTKVKSRAKEKLSGPDAEQYADGAQCASECASFTREQEEQAVEENAERVAGVVNLHRRDVRQGREAVELMLGELMAECRAPGLKELADQHIDEENKSAKAAAAIQKAVSLPGRAQTMRDLSQSMQRLIALERQAYSLDDREDEESYEAQLRRLAESDG